MGNQTEEGTLDRVTAGDGVCIYRMERVHAEIIAHADIEIGFSGRRAEQGAGIQSRVVHLLTFRMGIALDTKHKRSAGGSLRVKATFRPRCKCPCT